MTDEQKQALIAAAREARLRAYAPYSNFQVGAALLTGSGRIVTGCNVENASYGLTICAERVAVSAAVAAGECRFEGLAVATSNGSTPCGACRQVLAEFCSDVPIVLIDTDRDAVVGEVRLDDLLPQRFGK